MDCMKTIIVSPSGRLTLPAEVRRSVGIEGETQMQVEVDEQGEAITLRPVLVIPREDAWAYTPEHRELLRRAHADLREGRVRRMSEDELRALAD
jgi:AbrB family looped-hinge helix DNA binding protein